MSAPVFCQQRPVIGHLRISKDAALLGAYVIGQARVAHTLEKQIKNRHLFELVVLAKMPVFPMVSKVLPRPRFSV